MSQRSDAIARSADAMRDFVAHGVLLQDAIARTGGINGTDMQIVGLLMSEGSATPGELATRAGLSAGGSITAVIDRLERAGYVARSRDDQDRRKVLVSAIPEAVMSRVGPIYARVGAAWTDYLETLTTEQISLVNDALTRAAEINREQVAQLRSN